MPARELYMFDSVQLDSYLHRHGYLPPQVRTRTRAARAGSAWNSSKQGAEDLGAAPPGAASYCARAVTFGQKTRLCRSKRNRTDADSSRSSRTAIFREQVPGMTPENAVSGIVQPAGVTAENAALLFEYAYRGAGPGWPGGAARNGASKLSSSGTGVGSSGP